MMNIPKIKLRLSLDDPITGSTAREGKCSNIAVDRNAKLPRN